MPKRSTILRTFKLEREALSLLKAGQNELAVIVSQTLLELRVESEMTNLVHYMDHGAFGEAALNILPNYNLTGRTLKLFEALVGVRLRDEVPEAMDALRHHMERRNAIAHRGEEVSPEEASASVNAVAQVTRAVHVAAYKALGWNEELDEEERERLEWESPWLLEEEEEDR